MADMPGATATLSARPPALQTQALTRCFGTRAVVDDLSQNFDTTIFMTTHYMEEAQARPTTPSFRGFRYFAKAVAITGMHMRKLSHDPTELLTRAIQPMPWLLVFGQVFARIHAIPTGGVDYMAFLVPGILAQSVLFVAIFNSISVIWERDLGIVHKFLASPTNLTPRARRADGAPRND